MDALGDFLEDLKEREPVRRNFLGLLHILIGRRIQGSKGAVISTGVTWRALASELKRVRWEKDAVRALGLDPDALPPRDRERFWYTAIAHAGVDSPEATAAGDRLAEALRPLGYVVGPAPGNAR
jgi:hypothetical protein